MLFRRRPTPAQSGTGHSPPDFTLIEQKRNAALLLLINPDGELLFVRTRRFPNHWQSLGGGIEPDDRSARDAVAREAKEEAGLEVRPDDLVYLCDAPHDFGEGTVHTFVGWVQSEAKLSIDSTEIAEMRWIALTDALNLPMFPAMLAALRSLASRTDLTAVRPNETFPKSLQSTGGEIEPV